MSDRQQLSLEAAHRLFLTGSKDDLRAALGSSPAPAGPARLLLEGLLARYDGDVDRCVTILRQAYDAADIEHRYLVADCLAPVYVMRSEFDELEELIDGTAHWERIPGARHAFLALVAASRSDPKTSARMRDAAKRDLEGCADDLLRARVHQRLALSAYNTWSIKEATELALAAGTASAGLGDFNAAAASYSVAYHIQFCSGDLDLAYELAGRVVNAARRAGDESFELGAIGTRYEIAAELCDESRLLEHREEIRNRPFPEQYHGRFTLGTAELLPQGWSADFSAMRASALFLEDVAGQARGERSLATALLSLAEVALGNDAEARRQSRKALAITTAPKGEVIPPFEMRNVLLAQLLSGVSCILVGDATRGRRVLDGRAVAPYAIGEGFVAVLEGGPWESAARRSRGFVRLVAAVRDAVARRKRGPLTPAEVEVLKMLADGKSATEIAARTKRSVNTIRAHRSAVLTKLGATNTLQAINVAREAGLIA